ncbi:T-lymphocyte activation antigen CD86 isoform X10 [Pipistrellus kuhlii]|uniref:T-lymphocyte activation antigen CD86 isoform X10 n=1 Tax=Pipistrellus kuhlii TaxID=59472 RepID=UPI00174F2B8F|nr:T-lymphocyte activation antigen CD86 isoform X10 [Pipistrellus kuhlii]
MPCCGVPRECHWAYTAGLRRLRWMGVYASTMGLSTTVLVMAFLLSGAASMERQAYFNKTGDLPCEFVNSEEISLADLVVFWQHEKKMVLYELYRGQEKPQNVNAIYKNRTSLDQYNLTLRLHNVQIKDKGLYQCFIHHFKESQGMIPIHQKDINLSVLANFSQPEIMLISNRTENSNINMTCSSVQGYPKPKKMYFLLKTINSTYEYDADMKIIQDDDTGLYNVSISLSFLVFPETNTSIFCVLQPESTQIQLLSQPYNIEVIRAEGEESEQANERVENRTPERSNEAQCVVNISKTDPDLGAGMPSKEISSGVREEKHGRGIQEPF